MKDRTSLTRVFITIFMFFGVSTAYALTGATNTEKTAYPVDSNFLIDTQEIGTTSFSIRSNVGEAENTNRSNKVDNPKLTPKYISYGRGVGKIPNNSNCEAPTTENDWGLCYEPCKAGFTGVGPMCHGKFSQDTVSSQLQSIQTALGKGPIKGDKPTFVTDVQFNNVLCSKFSIDKVYKPGEAPASFNGTTFAKIISVIGDTTGSAISDKINESINSKINAALKDAIVIPAAFEVVLFDFSAGAKCESDTVRNSHTASLNFDASVTVQADSRGFDEAIHAASGPLVSVPGVVDISVYELIPFRIYGDIGVTAGAGFEVSAEYLNNPLESVYKATQFTVKDQNGQQSIVTGKTQVANTTQFNVTPKIGLALGIDTYLRLPSFVSFLPDLMQLGVNFDLNVVEWSLPYIYKETLNKEASTDLVISSNKEHALQSVLESGNGSIKPFFKILGIALKVFNKEHSLEWEGYKSVRHFVL